MVEIQMIKQWVSWKCHANYFFSASMHYWWSHMLLSLYPWSVRKNLEWEIYFIFFSLLGTWSSSLQWWCGVHQWSDCLSSSRMLPAQWYYVSSPMSWSKCIYINSCQGMFHTSFGLLRRCQPWYLNECLRFYHCLFRFTSFSQTPLNS